MKEETILLNIGRTTVFSDRKEKSAALREFFDNCGSFSDETIKTIVKALRE